MVSRAALRTAVGEEVSGETRGGAPRLKVSSGEPGGREDFLIRAGPRLPPGGTMIIDHQPVTITNAPARSHRGKGNSRNNSPHGRFDPFLALSSNVGIVKTSFLPVPEATLDETRPTADPGPHHGKQGSSAELAVQG